MKMAASIVFQANPSSPLKRSFDHAATSTKPNADHEPTEEHSHNAERSSLSLSTLANLRTYRQTKRRNLSATFTNSMLAQGTTIMSDSFPSLMSVYGRDENNLYEHGFPEHEPKHRFGLTELDTDRNASSIESEPQLVERRGSITSAASYSTDSSPTTTSSTFDSPLMLQKSPDSSPESASSSLPPRSFQPLKMVSAATQTIERPAEEAIHTQTHKMLSPSTSIEEPKRNLKNLSLDMKLPGLTQSSGVCSPDSLPFSGPTSPIREPLKTGRRKPTNLTIRTPGFNQLSFSPPTIPATPAQKPTLNLQRSSPTLPSLVSPTTGPAGGMRFNLPNIASNLQKEPCTNKIVTGLTTNLPSLREEPYQPPQSQEAPEKGYTSGPCLIYDEGVYLYLEPTAEEASTFDTVINVAKEIKNPFEAISNESSTVVSVWRNAENRRSVAEPQTALSEVSFKSAFEWPSSNGPATPTTPKAASVSQLKKPEYLHVQWDHNSEILEDLFPLCRLVEDRVREGKKVLIHCQLGVSRSASLIIAYGLYRRYRKDFHSMYMSVKERSQWVGPNMSLIYQLTDFKSKCDKGFYSESGAQPKPEWFIYPADNSATPLAGPQGVKDDRVVTQPEPKADVRQPLRLNKELPPIPAFGEKDQSEQLITIRQQPQLLQRAPSIPKRKEPAVKKAFPRALPFRQMGYSNSGMVIPHRPRIDPGLTFAQPSMDLTMQDVPSAPSLFSPRTTEFMATPFGIATAGDLATSTPKTVHPPPGAFPGGHEWRNSLFLSQDTQNVPSASAPRPIPPKVSRYDPRSPHHGSEPREIFRNIDGFI